MRKPLEWLLVVGLLALVCWGCNDSSMYMKKCIPTKGILLVDGKPLANVQIMARPVEQDETHPTSPMATTDEKGEFQFQTYDPNDGMPQGKYRLGFVLRGSKTPDQWAGKFRMPATDAKVYEITGTSVDLGTIELKTK